MPCAQFSGSRWVRSVSSDDDGEGLELVLLLLAVAAVVAAAGADVAGSLRGALSDGSLLLSVLACLVRCDASNVVVSCCRCLQPSGVRWPVSRLRHPRCTLLRRRRRRLFCCSAVRRTGFLDGL